MKDKEKKIVFFGTPEFAVPTLRALYNEGLNIVLAVTQPNKPVGRNKVITPSAIKVEAHKFELDVVESLEDLKLKMKELKPDVGVVVAYGRIIPKEVLDFFSLGCLNIHPSLLPKYRGPSPIQTAILNGNKETGVTVIKLDEKMDHGNRASHIVYRISPEDTYESLSGNLASVGAKLLVKTLPDYLNGKIKLNPQDDSLATFTKILKREDGQINWDMSAEKIERQVRAYFPWPGCYSQEGKYKIIEAEVVKLESDEHVGKLFSRNKNLYLQCISGVLWIKKIQPEGKKIFSEIEYINGYL